MFAAPVIANWTEQVIKQADMRRREISSLPIIIQVVPGKGAEVSAQLRRLGFDVQGQVRDFIFITNVSIPDLDKLRTIPGVKMVTLQKIIYPMAYGIDEIFKQVGITLDPALSQLESTDLDQLGIVVKSPSSLPTPFAALVNITNEAARFGKDPLTRILDYIQAFPPVITRADWKLVTDTRKLMEAPDENSIKDTKVAVIDTGVNSPIPLPFNPTLGTPFVDYDSISLTIEPPFDSMSHGSWCTAAAFGKPSPTRFGDFVPVASAERYLHIKVFTAVGPATSFQIMKAMDLCAQYGYKVVSMSLGGPLQGSITEDPECQLASDLFERYGTNFIVAAGNDGADWTINSPGASPDVLTVGAMDWLNEGAIASYSSRGPQAKWYKDNPSEYDRDKQRYGEDFLKPDLMGIGGDQDSQIVSACCPWYDGLYDFTPDGMDMMIGTSMATPHVAGLVALGIEHGKIRDIRDVKQRMKKYQSKDDKKGYGLLKWSILG